MIFKKTLQFWPKNTKMIQKINRSNQMTHTFSQNIAVVPKLHSNNIKIHKLYHFVSESAYFPWIFNCMWNILTRVRSTSKLKNIYRLIVSRISSPFSSIGTWYYENDRNR